MLSIDSIQPCVICALAHVVITQQLLDTGAIHARCSRVFVLTQVLGPQVHGWHVPELLQICHDLLLCKQICRLALLQQGVQLGQHLLPLALVQQVNLHITTIKKTHLLLGLSEPAHCMKDKMAPGAVGTTHDCRGYAAILVV